MGSFFLVIVRYRFCFFSFIRWFCFIVLFRREVVACGRWNLNLGLGFFLLDFSLFVCGMEMFSFVFFVSYGFVEEFWGGGVVIFLEECFFGFGNYIFFRGDWMFLFGVFVFFWLGFFCFGLGFSGSFLIVLFIGISWDGFRGVRVIVFSGSIVYV